MASPVKPIPEGYRAITPYLYLKGAAQAIEFYKKAFGAEETFRIPGPDGTVGHAEMRIDDSMIMLADNPNASPADLGGTSVSFVIYLKDVDAAFKRATDAGATIVGPLENKFYGDRMGMVRDPFGHEWSLATHIEDVSPEEMQKRAAAMASMAGSSQQ